ncbi:haloalkane dehalogenase [Rhodobacteraceae bacterium NNCM2]|nr:haloalkane dehalogenase [Coraliihabitans acroporae]
MTKSTLLAAAVAVATGVAAEAGTKLPPPEISEAQPFAAQSIAVFDSSMSWIETGDGDPVLFLHGNPTSSYLWRNVLPEIGGHRAVAVDLIGMGGSGKPEIAYTFEDHARYLDAFVETMGFETVTLVGHDWGAALAWDYAARHPERVEAIAFMEGVLPPAFPLESTAAIGEAGPALEALRTHGTGEDLVLNQNMFVEQMLPGFVNRTLGEEAMTAYRAPFPDASSRRPTLQWPRELPVSGEPKRNVTLMERIAKVMAAPDMPVLLLYVEPGVAAPREAVAWYRETIPGIETVFLGQGLHFIQEDHPTAIGRAISDWLRRSE